LNNDLLIGLAAIVIGYLAGSVSFSRVVTGLVSPAVDLEGTLVPVEGSDAEIHMNAISATSVRFKLGPRYGCLASFLDMVKVAVPVAGFHFFFPDSPADFLAATGGIIGHNWPIYYNFKGGYGHSAIYGALLVIEWTAVPVSFLGTAFLYFIFRQVHIASFGGVLLLIPWFWYLDYDAYALLYAGVCSAAYFIRVFPDFRAFRAVESRKSNLEGNAESE
jgi:glycerol-3-phosphate acyltransferase PlsY